MACIYQIRNLVNGKLYVGSTQKINSYGRRGEHFCALRKGYHYNKHLQASFNKYGEDAFVYEIIEEFLFPEDYNKECIWEYIVSRELYYIEKLDPQYNFAKEIKGGKIGRIVTQEQKDYLSTKFKGRKVSKETKELIRIARSKQVITSEHKGRVSLSMIGKKNSLGVKQSKEQKEETSRRVLENNKLGIGFHSKESKEKRTKTLKEKYNTPEMKSVLSKAARNRSRKDFIGYKDNIIIGEFSNQTEAGEILKLKASEIGAVLRGSQKTTKGYTFKYKI